MARLLPGPEAVVVAFVVAERMSAENGDDNGSGLGLDDSNCRGWSRPQRANT